MIPQKHKDDYEEGDLRKRDWNDRVAPPRNPVHLALADGRRPRNAATGHVLFAQSLMPVGEYAGHMIMERLPEAALRRYATARDFRTLPEWAPVLDYIERCRPDLLP